VVFMWYNTTVLLTCNLHTSIWIQILP